MTGGNYILISIAVSILSAVVLGAYIQIKAGFRLKRVLSNLFWMFMYSIVVIFFTTIAFVIVSAWWDTDINNSVLAALIPISMIASFFWISKRHSKGENCREKSMNYEALKNTHSLIERDFGDITDLPEELQNTLCNIYYKCSLIEQDTHKFAFGDRSEGNGKVAERLKKGMSDMAFYTSSMESLPEIITGLREVISEGNKSDIQFVTEVLLFTYKYRISNASSKSYLRARIEKFLSRGKVDEISDLNETIIDFEDNITTSSQEKLSNKKYETFEEWYDIFKQASAKENEQLEINEDGKSALDYMEHEPLERAFEDDVDPESLAVDFAKQFDIATVLNYPENK